MPETFYTSSQYYNLFFQLYFNRGLSFPLKGNTTLATNRVKQADCDINQRSMKSPELSEVVLHSTGDHTPPRNNRHVASMRQ